MKEGKREGVTPELRVQTATPPLTRRGAHWRCPKRRYGARFDEWGIPGESGGEGDHNHAVCAAEEGSVRHSPWPAVKEAHQSS
jgi:hypothetical protein